jgi:hypothetical protein
MRVASVREERPRAEFVASRKQKRQQDAGATSARRITQTLQYALGKNLSRRELNGLFRGVESGLQELPGIFTRVSLLEYGAT